MLLLLLLAIPTILGLGAAWVDDTRIDLGLLLTGAVVHCGLVVACWVMGGPQTLGHFLSLDPTGLYFLTITSGLFLVVSIYSVHYVVYGTHGEQNSPQRFVPCLLWFVACMTWVCCTQHLAILWAAVEATTLASAPLVYFYRRKEALEATWKYLLICSVGIALALLGVFFMGIASSAIPHQGASLQLSELLPIAPRLSKPWLRAAFTLALVGFGTKMGLAPMHTWLPDTHSQAPSPVSALLSGALLNCALLAILRFFQVCLAAGEAEFAQTTLLVLGLFSILVATAFLVGQTDYKRLFAYSSIENMGIIAVGLGLGGAATKGALLHAANHSVCKAGLFLVAGNVLREYGTTEAQGIRGVLGRLPTTGVVLFALLFALGGTPPFGPFVSEWMILQYAMLHNPGIGVAFVVLLGIAFLGMSGIVLPMLHGSAGSNQRASEPFLLIAAPVALLVSSLVLGIYLPPFFSRLLGQVAGLVGG